MRKVYSFGFFFTGVSGMAPYFRPVPPHNESIHACAHGDVDAESARGSLSFNFLKIALESYFTWW